MNASIAIYVGVGLAACALVLVGWVLGRKSNVRPRGDSNLLDAIIERQSPGSRRRAAASVPQGGRTTGQLALLEGHLRNAIFDPGAQERLVRDAMCSTGGDRAAAIRKVLSDLEREDRL